MIYWIFLISTLALTHCRPQLNTQEPAVEVEKQDVIELHPDSRDLFADTRQPEVVEKELEESTKEILEKIALVNEKQGLNKKKPRPYHFPFSYHLRAQEPHREANNFKFPRDPFTNPIFDYIEKQDVAGNTRISPSSAQEEVPPGHYIKRKVTHQQSMVLPPMGYMGAPNMFYDNKAHLEKQTVDNIKSIVGGSQYPNFYQSQLYASRPGKQQWQWPFGQFFPIVVHDPFVHMMNAVTTMVEYGPQASSPGNCKKTDNKKKPSATKAKQLDTKMTYNVVDNGKGAEITVQNNDDSDLTTVLDIEDLQITDNREDPLQLKLNFREAKGVNETSELRQSPPVRDQVLFDDEVVAEDEEKAEEIQISNQGTKKLVSKDNTGSGIFVHKIKVRKGGVAIAGPGGIATAGSGGTAIVGPNGFAYTHPDSLAIAGSGTKVVAVEPNINLAQVIADHNKNKTRGSGHLPSRIGKIVAVGPVIYYNKG